MKKIIIALFLVFLGSCVTDMEKRVKLEAGAGKVRGTEPLILPVPIEPPPPEIKQVEKPVYVPAQSAAAAQRIRGVQAVENSNSAGIKRPEEYSHAAMVYDYNADWVYEVFCMPLRASDLRLEPGERVIESPFVADSERWMLGAGVNIEMGIQTQHIYIKPTASNISASLIINTDRRVYHIILKSYDAIHMPLVYWRYPSSGMPLNFIGIGNNNSIAASPLPAADAGDTPAADPRFLSFNYKITYSPFQKPRWFPRLVYDDGKKTYINFDKEVSQMELPGVFENRTDVLNYRVAGNLIIIDKLISEITVRLETKEITIAKKR